MNGKSRIADFSPLRFSVFATPRRIARALRALISALLPPPNTYSRPAGEPPSGAVNTPPSAAGCAGAAAAAFARTAAGSAASASFGVAPTANAT